MPRKANIPIYDGDDFEAMRDLRLEVSIAERKLEAVLLSEGKGRAAARLGDDDPDAIREAGEAVQRAQDAYDAFVDEAAGRAEMWVLTTIGHAEFRELLKQHPPRKETIKDSDGKEIEVPHREDAPFGVNTETFPAELLLYVDEDDDELRTVLEPAFDDVKALKRRVKRLAAGEFDSLWIAALELNRGGIADPKLGRFSPTSERSDET